RIEENPKHLLKSHRKGQQRETDPKGLLGGRLRSWSLGILASIVLYSGQATAVTIGYTGRISTNGQPLNGNQYFRFAVLRPDGEFVWNSDRTSASSSNAPAEAFLVPVTNGIYRVELGSRAAGMREMAPDLVEGSSNFLLRVW